MRHVWISGILLAFTHPALAADLEFFGNDGFTGGSRAAVVGAVPLLHTAQVFPPAAKTGDDEAQVREAFTQLAAVLKAGGADPARVAKLNVYGTRENVLDAVKHEIAKRYPENRRPAVSFVVGKLPRADAVVALDAVAPAAGPPSKGTLPAGGRVHVSGQAEKGNTPEEATRKTLASLRKTLGFLGLDDSHVVQVKSFLKPMAAAEDVTKAIAAHFGEGKVPPLVFVEWDMANPIEIELIAADGPTAKASGESLEFLTPPGMTASPVFARATRVRSPKTIYTCGLYAEKPGTGEDEVKAVFESARGLLHETGSDFRHLAKATYYVSADDASQKLNALRPRYYDPKRPPAASKAPVSAVGLPGRSLTIDFIAVPTEK